MNKIPAMPIANTATSKLGSIKARVNWLFQAWINPEEEVSLSFGFATCRGTITRVKLSVYISVV
jgi:hypothetical protein